MHESNRPSCDGVLIRRAEAGDAPRMLPLVAGYWAAEGIPGFDPPRIEAQLGRVLSDPRLGAGWIAMAEDEAVGYLLAVYVFSLEHFGLTAEIDELFVAATQRAHGVAGGLLRAAESEFDRAGCTNVSLQVAMGNDRARAFYRRHGYAARSGYGLLEKELGR